MDVKAIGGYFEIEEEGRGVIPHNEGVFVNTGRHALEYIIRSIPDIREILLPYFTCDVVLQPIRRRSLNYSYYHINSDLEIRDEIQLTKGQYIIVNNYFGIKDDYIKKLIPIFGDKLIVDNAQALFTFYPGKTKTFYSVRKFIGVSDGGIAIGTTRDLNIENTDDSSLRLQHLYIRKEIGAQAGFSTYRKNESILDELEMMNMSEFTRKKIDRIDYRSIIEKRKRNFAYLHQHLHEKNRLVIPPMASMACPMVYPFLHVEEIKNLREKLIENKIFVPRYWPNVSNNEQFALEVYNSERIIPLPIDQRYDIDDMNRILEIICK